MTEATQEQKEYTARQLVAYLEAAGSPLSYKTVLDNLLPMLRDLGMVREEDRSTRGAKLTIVNYITEDTARALVRYLRARQEHPDLYGVKHSASTWRMLENLGYMRE